MKNIIAILILFAFVGCRESENGAYKHRPKQTDANESTPTTNTNKVHGTTAKPVKELTLREKVIGEYEFKKDGHTDRLVFLDNGIAENYENGKKREEDGKWKISKEGELHLTNPKGNRMVLRINKDSSITAIAVINKDGRRIDLAEQVTWKKSSN